MWCVTIEWWSYRPKDAIKFPIKLQKLRHARNNFPSGHQRTHHPTFAMRDNTFLLLLATQTPNAKNWRNLGQAWQGLRLYGQLTSPSPVLAMSGQAQDKLFTCYQADHKQPQGLQSFFHARKRIWLFLQLTEVWGLVWFVTDFRHVPNSKSEAVSNETHCISDSKATEA